MSFFRDLLGRRKRKEMITTANTGYTYKDVRDYEHNLWALKSEKGVLVIENTCGPRREMSVNPSEKVFSDRVNTCVFEK